MQLAKGVHMLPVTVNVIGQDNVINPVLLEDAGSVILVDTGYPGAQCLPRIDAALKEIGFSVGALTGVILTHQDLDHIGGLPAILNDHKVEVMTHADEKPYIQGDKKLIKISKDAAHSLDNLPENVREAFKKVFENPPTAKVDRVLSDGEELPLCGGVTVIHTPGHTPGSICLYVQNAKLLIAGDALAAHNGRLYGPVPEHAADIKEAYRSLQKLQGYDIEKVVCYHGGFAEADNKSIREIIDGFSG